MGLGKMGDNGLNHQSLVCETSALTPACGMANLINLLYN
jgi:hypothetical protein